MKVLIVTGRLAAEKAKEQASKHECKVVVAPIDVAALLDARSAVKYAKHKVTGIDVVLVPGLMKGELHSVEKALGVPTFRGPKNVADLGLVLKNINHMALSKNVPACELIMNKLREKAEEEIKKVNSRAHVQRALKRQGNMLIGRLAVGHDFPMRVLAEIVDVENLSHTEIAGRAEYYLRSGADIIDLGFGEENPEKVKEAVSLLHRELDAPVSVDTMEEGNIRAAIESGADLILSFDYNLLKKFRSVSIPSVVIPKKDGIPKTAEEKLALLEENLALAKKQGFKKIIADAILEPAGLGAADSIVAYKKFSALHSEIPVLFGAGNVTELFDADSVGMNALLAALAGELGASMVFTIEHSHKTRGSVAELAAAVKMVYLAEKRASPPKDLGIDLLVCKEKVIKRDEINEALIKNAKRIRAKRLKHVKRDSLGYFKIFVEDRIRCVHFADSKAEHVIEGESAKEICDTIFSLGLVSEMTHALYLGRELQKAEHALRLERSYEQS